MYNDNYLNKNVSELTGNVRGGYLSERILKALLALFIVFTAGTAHGQSNNEKTLKEKIAAREQLTDVPTVYLDFPNITDNPSEEQLAAVLYKNGNDSPYSHAKIQVVATTDSDSPHYMESFIEEAEFLEVKVRGNSTSRTEKKPYRLKFAKGHKHDMLNLGYKKRNWTLLANAFDKSMIRNAVTYHLGEYAGMPFTAGYKFVDLVINNAYRGTYQISDHPEVDADRIDVDEDTGWYVEFQGRSDMLDEPNFTGGGLQVNVKNPDTDDFTEEEKNSLLTEMKDWFINKWQKGFQTYSVGAVFDPTEGWRAYNDEETLMKFILTTEITGDYDGYMTVKAYRDTDSKLFWGPIWDKDLAYGNYGDYDKTLVKDIPNSSSVSTHIKEWLMKDPAFTLKLADMMNKLVENGLKENLLADIERLAGMLEQTKKLNYEKWEDKQLSMEKQYGYTDYQVYITNLKTWLGDRIDFIQSEFNDIATANNVCEAEYTYDPTNSNSGIYEYLNKLCDITMTNRTFTKDKWNTICVPFAIPASQLTEIFGEGYELKEMRDISDDGTTLFFYTPENNSIVAAMPYLIKPTKDIDKNPVIKSALLYNATNEKNGKEITLGNYTFKGQLFQSWLSGIVNLNDTESGFTFTPSTGSEATNGSIAYFKIINGVANPVICFYDIEDTRLDANAMKADNETELNSHIDKVVNVQIKNRTFGESYWNTLTLPFDVSAAQMAEVFGEGYDLEKYTSMTDNILHFTKVASIAAGKPYLLKPVTKTVEPTFRKVTLKNLNNGESVTHNSYSFCPALFPTMLSNDKTDVYLSTDGNLYYPATNDYTLYGTRAYFKFPAGSSAKISFTDDTTTSISLDGITIDSTSAYGTSYKVYYLNGQLVGTSMDGLPKGIYIVDGNKTIIK